MTQTERMKNGLIYDPMDPEILAEQMICLKKLQDLNDLRKERRYAITF